MYRRKEIFIFASGVLASVVANIIYAPLPLYVDAITQFSVLTVFASMFFLYLILKQHLIIAGRVCYGAILKIYSSLQNGCSSLKKTYASFMKISFLAETKRIIISAAAGLITIIFELTKILIIPLIFIYACKLGTEYIGRQNIRSVYAADSSKCNCPTTTKSNYASYPTTYSYSPPPSGYTQSCNPRLNYQKPVSISTQTTVVADDCFSGQKNKKNKGAKKTCSIITSASPTGYRYNQNSYGIEDAEPQ